MKRFEKDSHQIIMGDVLTALNELDDKSVNLIFADPPYNIGKTFGDQDASWATDEAYMAWCYDWLDLCLQKLADDGSMYIMCSTQCAPFFDLYLREKTAILSRIVWHYDSSGRQAKTYFGSLWEPILHCVKDPNNYVFNADDVAVEAKTGAKRKLIDYRKNPPKPYNTKKVPGNAWYFPRVRYRMPEYEEHPTQKPEALLERIILASSRAGQTVLDPFAGTFTTCAVAKRLGRASTGIELHEQYVKIGLRRVGIRAEYEGEILSRPEKSYEKKHGAASPKNRTVTGAGIQLELG